MKKNRVLSVALAVALLVAVGAVSWFAIRPNPVLRSIIGINPISADEAIFVTYRYEGDRYTSDARCVVEKVGVDGQILWENEIQPNFTPFLDSDRQIASDPGRVFIAATGPNGPAIFALARDTGAELWRTPMPTAFTRPRYGASMRVDGTKLIVFHDAPGESAPMLGQTVSVFSTETGSLLWPKTDERRYVGDVTIAPASLGSGRLLLSGLFPTDDDATQGALRPGELRSVVVDTATGATLQRAPTLVDYCVGPKGVVGLAADGSLHVLNSHSSFVEVPLSTAPGTPSRWARPSPCGIYKNFVVFGRARRVGDVAVVVVAVDIETGVAQWEVQINDQEKFGTPIFAGGELPRMLPIATSKGADGHEAHRLVVADLDDGKLVFNEALPNAVQVFMAAEGALVRDLNGAQLFSIDQTTGAKTLVETQIAQRNSFVGKPDLSHGRLWYTHEQWPQSGDPGWSVIDIATGKVLYTHASEPD